MSDTPRPTFTAEDYQKEADDIRIGLDRAWWPECPEVFREKWALQVRLLDSAAAQARTLAAETEARIAAQAEVDNLRHSQDHKWVDRAENAERTLAVRDAQLSQVEHRAFRQAEMLAAVQALTETGDWNIPVSKLRQILYGGDK